MPIQTLCPNCRTSFSMPDAVAGKKVSCRKCNKPFVAVAVASIEPATEAGHLKKVLDELARPAAAARLPEPIPLEPEVPVVRATPLGPTVRATPVAAAVPVARRKSQRSPTLFIGLIVGGVVGLIGLVVVGVVAAYFIFRAPTASGSDDSSSTTSDGPGEVGREVADLKGTSAGRIKAASALAQTPLDKTRQAEVARSLDPLLNDHDAQVRLAGVKALQVWATRDNVPGLIQVLRTDDIVSTEAHRLALEILGRLKDDRAAGPVAARLPNIFERGYASRALVEIGPSAEKAVLAYAFHPDFATRQEARQVLRKYGTSDEVLVGQALEDLGASDRTRRKEAAEWLAGTRPKKSPRHREVAKVLEGFLTETDNSTRLAGLKALARWATPESVPVLVAVVERDDPAANASRATVIETLGQIKDPRGAAAIAGRLPNFFDRGVATQALRRMGPVAEKAVVPYLFHKDSQVRDEAQRLIKGYGTKDDLIVRDALLALKDPDQGIQQAAVTWLSTADDEVLNRPETVQAVVPELTKILLKNDIGQGPKDTRKAAMKTLARMKDDKGAEAVAYRLLAYERTRDMEEARDAVNALVEMGSVAEPAVLKCLASNDDDVRITCCNILAAIGTKKSYRLLRLAARSSGRKEAPAAAAAIKQIQMREAKKLTNDKKP